MLTRTFTFGIDGGDSLVRRFEVTGGAVQDLDELIPAGSANLAVAFVLDVSQLKGLFMVCDKAVTVKTNSGGSPVNTFTLEAGIPFLWTHRNAALRDTAGTAVTTDITSLFLTNPGADDAAFQLRAILDPTV